MRYFIEPVVLTINYALNLGYKSIYMIGKSGGGWTTTLAAAIDPRIELSFPIAGSIPLNFHHKSWDFEQEPRPGDIHWYLSQCNYTCLYALAVMEPNRYSLQVLHERDPCCYYGQGRHEGIQTYDREVSNSLVPSNERFSTAITNWSIHAICNMDRLVIETAINETRKTSTPTFTTLPCDILYSPTLPCPWLPN